jgi:hypothetical protein
LFFGAQPSDRSQGLLRYLLQHLEKLGVVDGRDSRGREEREELVIAAVGWRTDEQMVFE